jgi:hypothetical protein
MARTNSLLNFTLTLLTISVMFSASGSWSGVERVFLEPRLQILKSEEMSIIITAEGSSLGHTAVEQLYQLLWSQHSNSIDNS